MRQLLAAILIVLTSVLPMSAQTREESLADIRQQLSVLFVEIQRLKTELNTTGGVGTQLGGTSVLAKVDAIEAEVRRLTSRTEELENRIDRIVVDGTNRIGDLEFRLVELEGGDISALGETTTLGGGEAPNAAPPQAPPDTPDTGGQLAVGEQVDFDRAVAAFEAGEFETAAELFQTFSDTYTGGPLTGEAHYFRGLSLERVGLDTAAARAYLESFSGSPQGAKAPDALLQLGLSLQKIGQADEACVTLGEVTARYPTSTASIEAQTVRASMGCT